MRYLHILTTALALSFLSANPASAQAPLSGSTRVFMTPTAWSLSKGQGYVAGNSVLLPSAQVGVTDRLSVGVFAPMVTVIFTPKYQFARGESSAAAVGLMHHRSGTGMGYVVASKASQTHSVSGGLGWMYSERGGQPMAMVAAEQLKGRVRLAASGYVMSWGGAATAGIRLVGSRFDAELGLVVPFAGRDVIVAPAINIIYKFGG